MRVIEVISHLARSPDETTTIELLHLAAQALGVEQAAFLSLARDDGAHENIRVLLACDPVSGFGLQQPGRFGHDPWLQYAADHSEPIAASMIASGAREEGRELLAAEFGWASAYVVPAPSSGSVSRVGVLCLGASRGGFFEDGPIDAFKVLARGVAMELHESWTRRTREDIVARCRISPHELQLLRMERAGLGTKEICAELGLTPNAVNSRFQRLNSKLATPSRRAAARLAAEYGLLR